MSAERDEIIAMMGRFAAAWNANDGEATASFFTEDGSLINPFGQRADGRAAISAMYTQFFASMLRGTTTLVTIGSVRPVGNDHAFVDADQIVHASDGSVVLAVHLATLVRRDVSGWRVVDARPYVVAAVPA